MGCIEKGDGEKMKVGSVKDPKGNSVQIIERRLPAKTLIKCCGCKSKAEQESAFYQDAGYGECGPFCAAQCAAEDAQEQHGPTDEELDYTYGSDGWRGM